MARHPEGSATSRLVRVREAFGPLADAAARRREREVPRTSGPLARRYVSVVGGHPWAASAVATTLFFVFVFPLNNAMSFPAQTEFSAVFRQHATEFAFALSLWCFLRWAIRFSVGVMRGDPHYRRWLAASSAYLALLLPVFIAIYPGHWVFDEFDTVYGATHFFPIAWQGYLTHVYYAFCLYLLPTAVGIVVVQICFISVVVGYVVTLLADRLRRPRLAAVVILALLSPAVLLNDFYPLRLTTYSYLLLLVLAHLLRRANGPRIPRLAEFFALCCGVAVLAFWRSEGIATLLLLPVAFIVLGVSGARRSMPRRFVGVLLAGLLTIGFSGWLSRATSDPAYQFTALINPLSTMTQGPLHGSDVDADLRAVDSVVDLEALRSMPSYTETPVFWAVGLRKGAIAHTGEFFRAYADLVIHNPGPFLDNRRQVFLAANSQTAWAPQVQVGGINGSNPAFTQKFTAFEQSTPFASAWNLTLKYQTARHLFLLDSALRPTVWTALVWNAIPSIVVVLLALAFAIVRRRWTLAACAAVLTGGAVLVLLTEPAAYFMYWFPVFLAGLVGGAVALALVLDRLSTRRGTRAAIGPAGSSVRAPGFPPPRVAVHEDRQPVGAAP